MLRGALSDRNTAAAHAVREICLKRKSIELKSEWSKGIGAERKVRRL